MDEHHDIDVNAIMRKIQSQVRTRTGDGVAIPGPVPPATNGSGEPPPTFSPEESAQITLERLLAFRDQEFIHAVYRHVLRREPDPIGVAYYLTSLRTGSLTRVEILVNVRFSQEGRQVGAVIPGLTRSYWTIRVAKLPVVGYLLQMVYGIWRLPVLMKNLVSQDAYLACRFSQLGERVQELEGVMDGKTQQAASSFHELLQAKADRQEVAALRATANPAASMSMVVELQHHLARLEFAKANRKEFAILDERMNSALSLKAERQEVAAVTGQVEAKADRQEVAALAGQVEAKADRQEVAALAGQVKAKADRQEVAALAGQVETKADRQEVAALAGHMEAKADRQEVAALAGQVETKAERQEVAALAGQVEAKAERQEVAALAGQVETKADRQEVAALTGQMEAKAERQEVAALVGQMEAKAERQEVAALAGQVETKAGRQEVAALAGQMEAKAERQEVAALVGQMEAKAERQEVAALVGQVEAVGASKADQHHLVAFEGRIALCENSRVDPNQVASLDGNLQTVAHQIAVCRQDLQDQHRRLGLFLELARKRMPEAFTTQQLTQLVSEEDHFLDSLYVAFEDRFRGGREAVRDGLKIYLPYVQKLMGKAGKRFPVLDVACGRGEWLELLEAQHYSAKGVDVNRAALEQCRELGLDVVEDDALEFLRKQPKNAFSAVTCFHYIEHIDFGSLVALLDESLRVLRPGGLAIFETPNARNILVCAGDFYRDPTHKNPVFPETLESIAELRGFSKSTAYCFDDARTELIPFSKYPFNELNDYVRVSRDAAWIGVKPL